MINDTKRLRYFELLVRPCGLTYGEGDCSAELGVTGSYKCYNSPRTCQVPPDYDPGEVQILRFAKPTEDLPVEIDALPCLTGIQRRPQLLEPGEGLGVRESVTVTMHNFKHNGAGLDKYIEDRDFNTYNVGTYWGKFFAWWGNLQGCEARTVDGYVGQTIDQMERRYYVVESHGGPDNKGNVSFTIKDIIKLIDGDKAQAPLPSPGVLSVAIDETETAFTLEPPGVGASYPASGIASLGEEIISYTRIGDSFTITARELRGSKLDDHEAGTTLQMPLIISSENPASIVNELLSYTDTPAEYYDLAVWTEEVNTYIGRLYSADIMRPTPIKTLLNELVREVGLIFYTDLVRKKIALKAMRAFVPTISVNDDLVIADTINSKPQIDKRVSDVWTYYGKRNPLEKQDELKNYSAIYASVTQNPIVALENLPRAIREITSRWITVFNQPAAQSINESILARYSMAPRLVSFKLPPQVPVSEGQAINVQSRIFEDPQGNLEESFQCQVLSVSRDDASFSVMAEEVKFTQIPVDNLRIININEDVYNLNVRAVHDTIYTPAESGDTIRLIISSSAIIGSVSIFQNALVWGDWPAGVTLELDGTGRIQGAGGRGGVSPSSEAQDGGPAMLTAYPLEIIGDVEIWGGGGGGAWGRYTVPSIPPSIVYVSGGGGAGSIPGLPNGTTESGGAGLSEGGGVGAAGGGPGLDGEDNPGPGSFGGDAGTSITGASFVTITGSPDIRGPQIP